eukprot:symbB.v1.2.002038.t3/scaffold105.1/size328853/4
MYVTAKAGRSRLSSSMNFDRRLCSSLAWFLPNVVAVGGYLTALQKAARWEHALLPELFASGVVLDVPARGAQLAASSSARCWTQVLALLQQLKKDAWMKECTVHALQGQVGEEIISVSQAKSGRTRRDMKSLPLAQEEQHLSESQDARYVSMREQIDKKAIQKRSEQLHFLDAEMPNKHTIFVDEDDLEEPVESAGSKSSSSSSKKKLKDFDVAKYFDTHPSLLKRKANRLRVKQLETKAIKKVEDAQPVACCTEQSLAKPVQGGCPSRHEQAEASPTGSQTVRIDVRSPSRHSASPATSRARDVGALLSPVQFKAARGQPSPRNLRLTRGDTPRIQVPFTMALMALMTSSVFFSCAAMFLPLELFTRSIRSNSLTSCEGALQIQTDLVDQLLTTDVPEVSLFRSLDLIARSVDELQILGNKAIDLVWGQMVTKKKFEPSWNLRSPDARREVAMRAWAEISSQQEGSPLVGIYSVLEDGTFTGYSVNQNGTQRTGLLWDAPTGGSPLTSRRTDLATGRRDGPIAYKGHVNMPNIAQPSLDKAAKVKRTWSPVFAGRRSDFPSMYWTAPIAMKVSARYFGTDSFLSLFTFGAMHPFQHANTVQYGQPQPQRQTYIHSATGPHVQMQPQGYVQGAQYTFYSTGNSAAFAPTGPLGHVAAAMPAVGAPMFGTPGMMPPSGSLLPGVAHPMAHPLPPEHSIGPEHKVTATPGPAGAETESSSEYESDSDTGEASPDVDASEAASPEAVPQVEVPPAPVEAAGIPTAATDPIDPSVLAAMPPSMTISQVPSLPSEKPEKDSFTNVNYQTHDARQISKDDINLQTRLESKGINEAPMLPTPTPKITTDDHLDKVLFPRGYRVDRTLPAKRKGFAPGALGKGAFGVVYKGFKRDGQEVALKVSENASATQPMLDQEIQILKMLDHPSIVKFHDAFIDKDSDWMIIAMELVSGGDLLSSLTGEPQVYEDRCDR